jgi:hypothetical protein
MAGDPVAWTMIEAGWNVVASDGADVGHVDEVTGDSTADIFNGLAISSGPLGKSRYVPAEQVAAIVDGRIELALTSDEVKQLGTYDEPPESAQILPDKASVLDRAEESLVGRRVESEPMRPLRRLTLWLQSLLRGRR